MATLLRRGGGTRHVQRMPQAGQTAHRGRGGPLYGTGVSGEDYRFDAPRDVRSRALRDAQGTITGLIFDASTDDFTHAAAWVSSPRRTADMHVYGVTRHGEARLPPFDFVAAEPAPWTTRPVWVFAHGDKHTNFLISVDTDEGSKFVWIDGTIFADILRNDPNFQEAERNSPGNDGALVACFSGHPDSTAAADMAARLHDTGSTRTWHAPAGEVVIPYNSNMAAYAVVNDEDSEGNVIPPGTVVSFPPPPPSQAAQGT